MESLRIQKKIGYIFSLPVYLVMAANITEIQEVFQSALLQTKLNFQLDKTISRLKAWIKNKEFS